MSMESVVPGRREQSRRPRRTHRLRRALQNHEEEMESVSYTHLTLPTKA